VAVREIAPPWVQSDRLNSRDEPRAMPLAQFIDEAMALLATDVDEVLVVARRCSAPTRAPRKECS